MNPGYRPFRMAGTALLASIAAAVPLPRPLAAQEAPGRAARAECELDSGGKFSLALSDRGKSFAWRLAAALPARAGDAGRCPAPIAFRAGLAAGPLLIGSILPSTELQRLKDPLGHGPCAALDSEPGSAVGLDDRPPGAGAAPGFQGQPGFAIALERSLPGYRALPAAGLRLGAGIFPGDDGPLFGCSALIDARPSLASIGIELSALAAPFGRRRDAPEEGWYLGCRPPLPAGCSVALSRFGARVERGPFSCLLGAYASGGSVARPGVCGEGGIAFRQGGLEILAALFLPLGAGSGARAPLLAIDGLPAGRSGWAEAGIDRAWRWTAAWKDPAGFHARAAYSGWTGRPEARPREYLPRRERLEAEAGVDWKAGRAKARAAVECSRVLQWEGDGEASASEAAAIRAEFDIPAGKKASSSFAFLCELDLSAAEGKAPCRGASAPFLIVLPGALGAASAAFGFKAEGSWKCRGCSATARLSSEDVAKGVALALGAEAALPRSGRVFIEAGPGATARIGWKNR